MDTLLSHIPTSYIIFVIRMLTELMLLWNSPRRNGKVLPLETIILNAIICSQWKVETCQKTLIIKWLRNISVHWPRQLRNVTQIELKLFYMISKCYLRDFPMKTLSQETLKVVVQNTTLIWYLSWSKWYPISWSIMTTISSQVIRKTNLLMSKKRKLWSFWNKEWNKSKTLCRN